MSREYLWNVVADLLFIAVLTILAPLVDSEEA